MFLQQIEEFVNLSVVGTPAQKVQASQQLHELKSRQDAVSIGMNLVVSATRDDARVFGTHLVRDFLQSGREMSLEEAVSLRQATMRMISEALQPTPCSSALPAFLVNNLLYILSLCIKRDYPERWQSAFHDILHIGQSLGWQGVDVVIKVLNELEVEVVVYNEDRTRDEITHNTLIKDTMRATSVIPDILRYLRDAIQSAGSMQGAFSDGVDYRAIASRAMLCLSSLIGWIDINLVVVELYPLIRSVLEQESSSLRSEALLCIYEIVKKGMDPVLKADLLQRLDILPVLIKLLPRFQGSPLLYQVEDELEDMKIYHKRIGMVLDITLVELLGCLIKYEEGLFPTKRTAFVTGRGKAVQSSGNNSNRAGGTVSTELTAVIPFVSHMLTLLLPEVINLVHHPVAMVAATVSSSIDKVIQLYKSQRGRESILQEFLQQNPGHAGWFILSQEYTDALLVALWQQSQYPADFALEDAAGEDAEEEFIEAKIEVRRLLINCARVNPQRFLEMVTCYLNELPKPLSKAPIAAIDICLHALQALDNAVLDTCPEAFHVLFTTLTQQSDLSEHPHFLIQIAFLEFSLRHAKRLNDASLLSIALSIVQRIQSIVLLMLQQKTSSQRGGMKNSYSFNSSTKQVAVKLTNLALKIVDVYPEKWKLLVVMALVTKDTIILGTESFMQSLTAQNNSPNTGSGNHALFPEVEVHLYEILGALSAFVPSASSWQHFDPVQHGHLLSQLTATFVNASTSAGGAVVTPTEAQHTLAQVSSLLPSLASSTGVVGGSNASPELGNSTQWHVQYVQPLQLQILLLMSNYIHVHCRGVLAQPATHQMAFQATFELFLAQQMRNMIALLEKFNKQYSGTAASSAISSGTHQTHLLPLLEQCCNLTSEIFLRYSQAEMIRQRVFAFLRVLMILLPNQQTFSYIGQMLPLLLTDVVSQNASTASFCGSIESLVELLNQVMVEFHCHSVHLLQSVAPQLIAVLWQRIEECLSFTSVSQQQQGPDVAIPIKILLSFLVHIVQYRLSTVLFPVASNDGRGIPLPQVLSWLMPLLKGFVPTMQGSSASGASVPLFAASNRRIVKFTSLAYRRSVVLICHHLLQHFMLDPLSPPISPVPPVSTVTAANSASSNGNVFPPSAEQRYCLQVFLLQEALPTSLFVLGSSPDPNIQLLMAQRHSSLNAATGQSNMEYEHMKLNLQDAATQSVLVEIATFLYLLAKYDQLAAAAMGQTGASVWPASVSVMSSGVQLSIAGLLHETYMPWLLMQWLCWSTESAQMLCATLWVPRGGSMMAISTFREQFKQFLRQYLA